MNTKDEIMDAIHSAKSMVLATSSQDRVTARTLYTISDGFDIYFNTDKNFLKVKQIRENPNVALCRNEYQFEGVAEILGHPRENLFFYEEYKKVHASSFERYSNLDEEIIIKVSIKKVQIWRYIDGKPFFINYDVDADKVEKKEYKIDV